MLSQVMSCYVRLGQFNPVKAMFGHIMTGYASLGHVTLYFLRVGHVRSV